MKQRHQSRSQNIESPGTSNKEKAETYFAQAKQQQQEGKYRQALQTYLKVIICDQNYFKAHCNIGTCYKHLGRFNEAKNSYKRALSICKDDPISHYNLGNLYRIIGSYQESIKHYSIVVTQHEQQQKYVGSLYLNSLINIGVSYKNERRFQEAVAVYEKVNRLSPEDEGGLFNHATCLIGLIQFTPSPPILNQERAGKIRALLNCVQKINPGNKMVQIERLKLDVLLDRNPFKVDQTVEKLKQLLQDQSFSELSNEIYNAISFCQGFWTRQPFIQKQYVLPEPNIDVRPLTPQPSIDVLPLTPQPTPLTPEVKPTKHFSLFQNFSSQPSNFMSENQVLKMLQQDRTKQVETYLKALPNQNPQKYSLMMILNIHKGQTNSKFIYKADQIYEKHLTSKGSCLPFEQLSEQTHKSIGKLLNMKKRYEQAAEHFEYVSTKMKNRSESIASQHSILGQGFEQAGNMQRALQQYRAAFELQPQNEIMSYNLGCCLYQNGHKEEAINYFKTFLSLLDEKQTFNLSYNLLFRTQASILIALCSHGRQNKLSLYREAFQQLQTAKQKNGDFQIQESHMLSFFVNYSELVEAEMLKMESDKLRTQILSIYSNLLEFRNCPDKQQILHNAGMLTFEAGHYLSSIRFYSQLDAPPSRYLAISYFHLVQPVMTMKHIQETCKNDPKNPLVLFTREVIEWVYFNENRGDWGSQLPKTKEVQFYERHFYAISLLQKIETLVEEEHQKQHSWVIQKIQILLSNPSGIKLQQQYKNARFQKTSKLLQESGGKQPLHREQISPQIIRLCFHKSPQPQKDFNLLIDHLSSVQDHGQLQKVFQTLIYFFIYYNYSESNVISNTIKKLTKKEKVMVHADLDKIVETDEAQQSILPSFTTAKDLVQTLKEWEQVLTPKIQKILPEIQSIYYSGNIPKVLQVEYHFPRHSQFLAADENFLKFMQIVCQITNIDRKISCQSNPISDMKKELIKAYLKYTTNFISKNKLRPINLSSEFLPVTVYSHHLTQQDSQHFVRKVLQLSTLPVYFQHQKCDENVLILNKLVRLRCRWGDHDSSKNEVLQILQHIAETPLDIVNQSIVALQKLRQVLLEYSPEASIYINQDLTFKM